MASDSGDYTYTIKPGELRTFDLATGPERLQTYCDALDRRVERLEAALRDAGYRIAILEDGYSHIVHSEGCVHQLLNPGEVAE